MASIEDSRPVEWNRAPSSDIEPLESEKQVSNTITIDILLDFNFALGEQNTIPGVESDHSGQEPAEPLWLDCGAIKNILPLDYSNTHAYSHLCTEPAIRVLEIIHAICAIWDYLLGTLPFGISPPT